MANLNLLKDVGTILQPVVKDLATLAASDEARVKADKQEEVAAVKKLRQFVADTGKSTAGSKTQAMAALSAIDDALTELSIQSMSNLVALTPTQAILLSTLISNIESQIGILGLRTVFTAVNRLLSDQDLDLIDKQLQGAEVEIANRAEAKQVLDTVVDVLIVAGQLAAKLVV